METTITPSNPAPIISLDRMTKAGHSIKADREYLMHLVRTRRLGATCLTLEDIFRIINAPIVGAPGPLEESTLIAEAFAAVMNEYRARVDAAKKLRGRTRPNRPPKRPSPIPDPK